MNIFGYTIPQVYKAIAGFFTPGVIALGVAITTESPGGPSVSPAEWIGIVLAMLATGGLVFMVPPSPVKLPPVEPVGTKDFNDRGCYNSSSLLVALACIVIVVVGMVWLVRQF